jgi:hypothetical protein
MTAKRFISFLLMVLFVVVNLTAIYTYADDRPKIKIGMKSAEIENAWGKPNKIELKDGKTVWTYTISQKQQDGAIYTKYFFLYFDKSSKLVMVDSMEKLSPPK